MEQRPLSSSFVPVRHLLGLPVVALLFSVTLFHGETNAYMVGKNPYRRVEYPDSEGKYRLEWEVDNSAERIIFNVTVETTGYVGFGLRKDEKSDADIVIGGVYPNGLSYFSDYHAPPYKPPIIDDHQDYQLHQAWENATHTFLSFSRDLDTCDPQDYPLVVDKVSLIWAYGETDLLGYHHKPRGAYPVHLLNPDYTPPIDRDPKTSFPLVVHSPYNEDIRVWSFHVDYVMPRDHTTYWCNLQKGPPLSKKHHTIGFETRFNDETTRNHLHHVTISKCRAPPGFTDESLFEQYVNQGQVCYGVGGRSNSLLSEFSGPIPTEYCSDYLHSTAIGDRIHFLPPHVGTPFGDTCHEYYLIQLHVDNPEERDGVRLDANFDVFYTPQLRKNEGDVFVIRHESPGLPPSHLIPPFSIAQKSFSICGSECSRKILPEKGIRIVALRLHVHHSGVGARLRHFRDGRELSPVAVEDNYNFLYQQMRTLPEEVHVLPGDELLLECTTNSIWANGTVMGGFATSQEMCAAGIFYYNRLHNHMICASEIDSPEFMLSFLGIANVTWSTPHLEYLVTSPRELGGLPVSKVSDMLDWTLAKREELDNFLFTYPHSNRCPAEKYARPHERDESGEPVDLKPDENTPVLNPLPKEARFFNSLNSCSSCDINSAWVGQRNPSDRLSVNISNREDKSFSRGKVERSTANGSTGPSNE